MLETRIYGDAHSGDRQRPDGKTQRIRLRNGVTAHQLPTWSPVGQSREFTRYDRRRRRTGIVQCVACGAKATGMMARQRLISADNLPTYRDAQGSWRHKRCGGVIRAYDITGEAHSA